MRVRASVLITLLAVGAAPATSFGARSHDWSMRLFPAADGSNVRFTTIAEDGAAAGAKFLADGTPRALYFNGKRVKDLSPRLGVVSSITGLNDRHQAAGYASSNPAARVANLFGANPDPSIMPRAFFLSGRTLKRLSVPSAAFGINIAGEVAGSFRAKDGLLHGFLWRPGLRKRRGRKTFIDLGVGDQHGLLWRAGGAVISDANSLPGVALPPGTTITNAPAVSDTGLSPASRPPPPASRREWWWRPLRSPSCRSF